MKRQPDDDPAIYTAPSLPPFDKNSSLGTNSPFPQRMEQAPSIVYVGSDHYGFKKPSTNQYGNINQQPVASISNLDPDYYPKDGYAYY